MWTTKLLLTLIFHHVLQLSQYVYDYLSKSPHPVHCIHLNWQCASGSVS